MIRKKLNEYKHLLKCTPLPKRSNYAFGGTIEFLWFKEKSHIFIC